MSEPHQSKRRIRRNGLSVSLCILLILPLVASASWNPLSWFKGWFGVFPKYAVEKPLPQSADNSRASASQATTAVGSTSTSPITATNTNARRKDEQIKPTQKAAITKTPVPPKPTATVKKPRATGTLTFSDDISLHRYTTGSATSSNTILLSLPGTSTKISIKQSGANGISFKPGPCLSGTCTPTNIISVASSVKEGTYPISATASTDQAVATGTYSITVLPAEPLELTLTVSGPASATKNVGGAVTATNTIRIGRVRGTPELLTITQTGFPDGVTGKTNATTCMPPCVLQNTVTIAGTAESGSYPIIVRATGKTASRSGSYDLNIKYSNKFGMHFKGTAPTYTRTQSLSSSIVVDHPFDLLLDGGTSELAVFSTSTPNASTTITYSQPSCMLPCKNMTVQIVMSPVMKPTTYTAKLQAVVNQSGWTASGTPKVVKYTTTMNVPIKIISAQ